MVGCVLLQRSIRAGRIFACSALLAACAQIHNDPINQPLTADPRSVEADLGRDVETYYDDMVVALSFSGGGTRAAAFSYGVLQGFDETTLPSRTGPVRCSTGSTFSPAFPAARCSPPITD